VACLGVIPEWVVATVFPSYWDFIIAILQAHAWRPRLLSHASYILSTVLMNLETYNSGVPPAGEHLLCISHSTLSCILEVMAFLPLSLFIAFSLCLQTILAKTVTYNWAITWVSANPDGEHVRPVIGINGQWPCPTLKASVGDNVVVNVQNQLGNQSTALHWHGLYQHGTAAMDGPVGITQCAIPPGGSQTYSFTVSLFPNRILKLLTDFRSTNLGHTSIIVMRVASIQMDYEARLLSMIQMPILSMMRRSS
jgi:hypothetical protein